jgi:ketosteroid isomerase-like protein
MPEDASFADWLAIANVKAAYCRLLDAKDWDGWGALFTDDFLQDVSGSGGGIFHGREAAVEATRASIQNARTAHQVHFPEITIEGDKARAIWPLHDRLIWEDGRSLTAYGHYHERYLKQDGRWRIAEQKLTRLVMDYDATGE